MKIGDKIITFVGEKGTIDHKAEPPYDWWIKIVHKGGEAMEPYVEAELSLDTDGACPQQ